MSVARRVHHVGLSVSDLEAALAFWEGFLGHEARWRTVLNRPYLSRVVGIPGVRIKAALVDLPGGGVLELLDYQDVARATNDEATPNPGHVHLCLEVEDIDASVRRAVECGARPVDPGGPADIDGGPNRGARGVYLRIPPDRATLELFQPPPP